MSWDFLEFVRETRQLLPPTIDDYVHDTHLTEAYSGGGKRPYHPAMMSALIFHGFRPVPAPGRRTRRRRSGRGGA